MIQLYCKLRAHCYLSFAGEEEKIRGCTTGRRDDIRGKGSIASIHSEIVQHEFLTAY